MAEVTEEPVSSANVRDLIFAYEHQTSYSSEPLENYEGRQRAKSIGNALSYKLFRQPDLEIHNVVDIEKELVKIEAHLNYYEEYEKETHVAFQEQLFNVLTHIVSIDPEGHETTIQKKTDLITETQKLAKILNLKLPFEGNHLYRGFRRAYSKTIKKEEAIVSTTSVKTQEHKAVLSSSSTSQSTLNNTYNISEDSLINNSSNLDASYSTIDTEDNPESAQKKIIVTDADSNYVPSVSKLKKFFSFRRNDKSEIKVIPAAYSGVSRSQSLNLKTKKYTITKREKTEESIKEKDENIRTSSPIINEIETASDEEKNPINLYVEPTKEIEEYRETQKEAQHNNISVSKLKGLFEDKQKETDEGLGLLTKKQFSSDFNLPYTEANLGAFRLKRTISGSYMNFVGLLRNVDIQKKSDLNKSKSMSDLKSDGLRYQIKDIYSDDDNDLSKEVDDGDEDFEHDSINDNEDRTVEASEELTTVNKETNEEFITGKVGVLKKNFENLQTSASTKEHKNDDIKHIIHRTMEPIPNSRNPLEEPVLKVPIQLRIGFAHHDFREQVHENSSSTTESKNEDIKITSTDVELPQVQPTIDTIIVNNNSQEVTDFPAGNKVSIEDKERVITSEDNIVSQGTVEILKQTFEHLNSRVDEHEASSFSIEEEKPDDDPISSVLAIEKSSQNEEQDVVDVSKKENTSTDTELQITSSRTVEILKQNFENLNLENGEALTEAASSPSPNQPIQIATYSAPSDNFSASTDVEEIKQVLHRTIVPSSNSTSSEEPVLKVPIQLRIGFSFAKESVENETSSVNIQTEAVQENSNNLGNLEENINVSSRSVEALKQTFENLSRSNSLESYNEHPNKEVTENLRISREIVLEQPVELKAAVVTSLGVSENIKESYISHSKEATIQEPKKKILKAPIELRVSEETVTYDNNGNEINSPTVAISLYNGNQLLATDASGSKEQSILSRAKIETKTENLMNILESPTAYSTLLSSSSQSQQVSSTSELSVSYSEKKSVQHTSATQVSHKVVSSSSSSSQLSELSSRKYLHVLSPSSSQSFFSAGNPTTNTSNEVIITEPDDNEKPNFNLNISQENILEELLKDNDLLENVDEKFEKILEEKS